ncbi:MAG: hypothetical protein U0401_12845 [Anaerolineae bacterium]
MLINEFSAVGQAPTVHNVPTLVRTAFDVINDLEPIRGSDPILTHSSLFRQQLSPNYTLHKWASEKSANDRDLRVFFVRVVTQRPFIDKILDNCLEYHECYFNKQDVSSSSIAGAAFFKGILVSFQDAPAFTSESIQVIFSKDGKVSHNIEIRNLTHSNQVHRIRRNYVPSPKHDPVTGWATKMDLEDQVAQQVLDNGIQNGKQVYGYHSGKFYVFQPDNTIGYHGYPISRIDVPTRVLREMQGRE